VGIEGFEGYVFANGDVKEGVAAAKPNKTRTAKWFSKPVI
jgi:hypothetical protein